MEPSGKGEVVSDENSLARYLNMAPEQRETPEIVIPASATSVVTHKQTDYQAPTGKEPTHPIYLAWMRNNFQPDKPWPQVWYGIDYSEAPEHKAMMTERFIEKHKVAWEHRFLGIENLAQLYPCSAEQPHAE